MNVVTTAQMREIDALTITEFETPGVELMDRAGEGLAHIVDELARLSGFVSAPVRLFAGKGNNGGDIFVAARYLKDREYRVEVWLAGEKKRIGGDARKHLDRMERAGIVLEEVSTPGEWEAMTAAGPCGDGIVVDGILGTGITGPARGVAAAAIQFINRLSETSLVVAADVPSGLDSDTGEAAGDTVHADLTATIGLPKVGLLKPAAIECVGSIEVVDIGIPSELVARYETSASLIARDDVRRLLPSRARSSHKGTYGHVLVVGGAPGFSGAVALAVRAALRSGAGLVSALVPSSVWPIVAGMVPEAMIHPGKVSDEGGLSSDALDRTTLDLDAVDAILVGPGLTTGPGVRSIVEQLLRQGTKPLIIDADGLNVIGADVDVIRASGAPVIVTPHPGEMSRLTGLSTDAIQQDRWGTAQALADATETVVVLKGAGTVVASPGRPLSVNVTGNPGMARGGMGDVLGGMIASLVAQGLAPPDAAAAAVYLHGRCGDRVAWLGAQAGMLAGDVIEELMHGFAELTPR